MRKNNYHGENMKLGEKIKAERKRLGLTQNAIAGDFITRNMLSAIESSKVTPSLDTLHYLSETLNLPIGYLLDEDADLSFYQKEKNIAAIREAYKMKKYRECLALLDKLDHKDDEAIYLTVCASFSLGRRLTIDGDFKRAEKCFDICRSNLDACIYPTEAFRLLIPLYSSVLRNVQSPLLELDATRFTDSIFNSYDYEFFRYIHQDHEFSYKNETFRLHMQSKALIRARKYNEAIAILHRLEDMKGPEQYNSCVILGVYSDLEFCYKELVNFEQAYRYANKRISLLEGFRT
jgi:transcriptional regulator with XRE-family HTH domain